jgi:hypothetical protein
LRTTALRTLGVEVSERTVSRLLAPHTRPAPQTWKTFLTNHLASAASMDFFTVPTLIGRVLFVVIMMSHVRRHIVHAWARSSLCSARPILRGFVCREDHRASVTSLVRRRLLGFWIPYAEGASIQHAGDWYW